MSGNKIKLIEDLKRAGFNTEFIINLAFLGYKYKKNANKLYGQKNETPTELIKLYYGLSPSSGTFDRMKTAFIKRYIDNESELENAHTKGERMGLKRMYEYIHSDDIDYLFDVYTLKDLNQKLFSYADHPEYAGDIRNHNGYILGSAADIYDWTMIRYGLNEVDKEVQKLLIEAKDVVNSDDVDKLLEYLDRCVVVGCQLIKIHPFCDGNGRTIRGFINKLFENVNLPPVYIKKSEKDEYYHAMGLAINEENYQLIKGFYRYKVCDSIIELDINNRIKNTYQGNNPKVKKRVP